MCRFAFYLGSPIVVSSLVTEPSNSIIHQSFHSHERSEPLNGDGFGVSWYAPEVRPQPALFRDVTPAWSDANLHSLSQVTVSPCIFAHVRAASPGLPVTRLNCHPFTSGRFAFMHNGHVGGFAQIVRRLQAGLSDSAWAGIRGSTDSEHLFAWFCDCLAERRMEAAPGSRDDAPADSTAVAKAGAELEPMSESMAAAMRATIADQERLKREAGIEERSLLNLVVSDGREAVITRYITGGGDGAETLYVHAGGRFVCEQGVCRLLDRTAAERGLLVASEPLSDDPGWEAVPVNHLLLIRDGLDFEISAL